MWKTLADDPIVNVASRYGGISLNNQKLMGLNNIELISDRTLEDNLAEISGGQEEASEERGDRIGDGGIEAGILASDHQADSGCGCGWV